MKAALWNVHLYWELRTTCFGVLLLTRIKLWYGPFAGRIWSAGECLKVLLPKDTAKVKVLAWSFLLVVFD